jgi:hypothetical protein
VPLAADSVLIDTSAGGPEEVTADVELKVEATPPAAPDDGEERRKESESPSFPLPDSETSEAARVNADSASVQAGEVKIATAGKVNEGTEVADFQDWFEQGDQSVC